MGVDCNVFVLDMLVNRWQVSKENMVRHGLGVRSRTCLHIVTTETAKKTDDKSNHRLHGLR